MTVSAHPASRSAPPQFLVTVGGSSDGGTIDVRVCGELDRATAPQLSSHLAKLNGNGSAIDLDLGRVTFIDLAGLRAILEARDAALARDQRLRIAVPGRACDRLLELTRTTHLRRADSRQLRRVDVTLIPRPR
jgi:anti-anti-sigma factor